MSRAACKGYPTSLWFPDKGWTVQAAQAKLICSRCPVRAECLEAGLGELGIWGGMSERARRPILQARPPRTGKCRMCGVDVPERWQCCSASCRKYLSNKRKKGVA